MACHESKHPSIFPWKTSRYSKKGHRIDPQTWRVPFQMLQSWRDLKNNHIVYISSLMINCNSVVVIISLSRLPSFLQHIDLHQLGIKSLLWWQNPHCIHPVSGINFHFQRPLERTGVFPYQDEDITQVSRKSIHHDSQAPSCTIFKDFIFSYWGMIPFYVSFVSLPQHHPKHGGNRSQDQDRYGPLQDDLVVTRMQHKRPRTSGIIHVSMYIYINHQVLGRTLIRWNNWLFQVL